MFCIPQIPNRNLRVLQSKNCESYRIFAYFCGIKFIKLDVREDLELVERLVAFFYQIWRAQNGAALHYENEFHRAKFEPISDCIDKHVGPIQHEHLASCICAIHSRRFTGVLMGLMGPHRRAFFWNLFALAASAGPSSQRGPKEALEADINRKRVSKYLKL
jgi:hypothetical protein